MKKQKGITLIALIITIIVMLILVGVSVTVALNGGLFSTAKQATGDTEIEKNKEQDLLNERIKIGDVWYDSIEAYRAGTPSADQETGVYVTSIQGLQETVTLIPYKDLATEASTEIKAAVDAGKVQAVLSETIDGTKTLAVIPVGFEVSTVDTEDSISEGLVVKNGANEFVWIPYTSASEYEEDNLGPVSTGEDDEDYEAYNPSSKYYDEIVEFDIDFETDKTSIETSINTYKGFYVGRYETTITDNNGNPETFGSVPNTEVLTSAHTPIALVAYDCLGWGLYKVQKDMYEENEAVFSSMITNKEWNLILGYTGELIRDNDTYDSHESACLSGAPYSGTTDEFDVGYNIYDLAGNIQEITLTVDEQQGYRYCRGGHFQYDESAFSEDWCSFDDNNSYIRQ